MPDTQHAPAAAVASREAVAVTDRAGTRPEGGHRAPAESLIDVSQLVLAYHRDQPDPTVPAQRVVFGTSGHRGSALDRSFNEWHVLAITQAICDHRRRRGINGPLFMGIDTHALSAPACASALEVLAGNGVDVMLATGDGYTPTPAVSHAILGFNRVRNSGQATGRADGIIVTPSHNPPRDGGIKYNAPHGGPAGAEVTAPIEARANAYLAAGLRGVRRMPHARALKAATTHRHDYLRSYVDELDQVIDLQTIRQAGLHLGVDPMGGAGVHYWPAIAERWGLDLTVVCDVVDPTFRFMPRDWDGRIRMDPSSPAAMQRLIRLKDRFDVAFACDTDHDRHGIVTPHQGLMPPNHVLCVAIDHLMRHRPGWAAGVAIGKSVACTRLIDAVAARLQRAVFEVPVGFKWFSVGLLAGQLGFAGEESAGASFLRRDGRVWTTDKDGITAALLAAEITARTGRDLSAVYADLARPLGQPVARRVEAPATPAQRLRLAALLPAEVVATRLAGQSIESITTHAAGNGAPIGGIKVSTAQGWFLARPSGTEALYRLYAESFRDAAHLRTLLQEAQALVDLTIDTA